MQVVTALMPMMVMAMVVFREIAAHGETGSYYAVRVYLRQQRPALTPLSPAAN
jgi:hypothetical protein